MKTHQNHYLYSPPFGMLVQERVYTAEEYRFGFNGQEKDNEISGNGNSNIAEFWQYDSRLGRRWNQDPFASYEPGWSSYRAFFNNPIYWIDPLGLLEDDYGVDKEGNISLMRRTTDKEDKLFSIDDSGNKMDLNIDGNSNNDYITIKDKTILPKLSKSQNGVSRVNNINTSNDLLKMFVFVAQNTNVEWRFDRYIENGINKFALGTIHQEDHSPTQEQLGYNFSKTVSMVHSHPKSDSESYEREKESMGWKDEGSTAAGDWVNHRRRVQGRDQNGYPTPKPYPNYVYFPGSGNLFSIEYKGPTYIRKINGDYKRFNFGVLNHQ